MCTIICTSNNSNGMILCHYSLNKSGALDHQYSKWMARSASSSVMRALQRLPKSEFEHTPKIDENDNGSSTTCQNLTSTAKSDQHRWRKGYIASKRSNPLLCLRLEIFALPLCSLTPQICRDLSLARLIEQYLFWVLWLDCMLTESFNFLAIRPYE